MKQFKTLMILLCFVFSGLSFTQTVLTNYWIPNGPVRAIVNSGGNTYIGGNFTYLGPYTGGFAKFDRTSAQLDLSMPEVNKDVFAVTEDGSGGWFIGGEFSSITGSACSNGFRVSNIAHIRSDKTIDTNWNPGTNGPVRAIVVAGNKVFAGGTFTSAGCVSLHNLAAFDLSTGKPDSTDINVSGTVLALAVSGNTLFIGGSFDSAGTLARMNIAALDIVTKKVTSWNPGVIGPQVNAMIISGNLIYLGGYFWSIGGALRTSIAALDINTGKANAWNPGADYMVNALALSNGIVYACGGFEKIGGQSRRFLAALDTAAGVAMPWNPDPDMGVEVLKVSGNTVFVAGQFSKIGGQLRSCIAALDAFSGLAAPWNPGLNGPAYALFVSEDAVYAGGVFASAGGVKLNYLAALGPDGKPTDWTPMPDGPVNKLAISGNTIYVAGDFKTIGGQSRNSLAAITTAGDLTAWNPQPDAPVRSLYISENTIYTGGDFTRIGGQQRHFAAALDINTAAANSWDPHVNSAVEAFAVNGNVVYLGGYFSIVDGHERYFLAAVDLNGRFLEWLNGNYICAVHAMAIFNNSLYVGGDFNGLGRLSLFNSPSSAKHTFEKINTSPLSVNSNETVDALFVAGNRLYAGGAFPHLLDATRYYLASIDINGQLTSWAPVVSNEYMVQGPPDVLALSVAGNTVFAGGYFRWINCVEHSNFAAITDPSVTSSQTISGVVSFDGKGIKDVTVCLWGEDNKPYPGVDPALTNSEGYFEFRNIPAVNGLKVYIMEPEGFKADKNPQNLQNGSDNNFSFNLKKTSTSAEISAQAVPKEYKLYSAYPNPFNPVATIVFDLPVEGHVSLKIYSSIGKEAAVLSDETMPAGRHSIILNAADLASGVYLIRMNSGSFNAVQKVVLLK